MPGRESLRRQQYYAYPRNAFWFIMGRIFRFDPGLGYQDRCSRLNREGLALWDVIWECRRHGSLDANIIKGSEVPNDFGTFLRQHPGIGCMLFNGQKSRQVFDRLVWPQLPDRVSRVISLHTMPSTSPANTRMTRDEKLVVWRGVIESCLKKSSPFGASNIDS
jgi:TDG/mug DNA glycosylase family protein